MRYSNSFGTTFYFGEDRPQKVIEFLKKVDDLCKEYGFCIEHEDQHGAFFITDGDDNDWFLHAHYETYGIERKEE